MADETVIVMNPPNPPGYVSNKDSMGGFGQLFPQGATKMPPLDLIYLTSYLVEKGIGVEPLECLGLGLGKEEAVAAVHGLSGTDGEGTLVVVRTSTPTLDWDLSVCAALKARDPALSIALYGAVVRHTGDRIQREASIDYIIHDEPDETVFALVTGESLEAIDGLSYQSPSGWVHNSRRPFQPNLDQLPFPRWELFPHDQYRIPKSSLHAEVKFLPMLTSRGCPVGCHYCPYPVGQGDRFRKRSPQNVVDEIEHLVHDLGVEYILFRDPIFSLNQRRVMELCQEIVDRGLTFKWRCETRIDCLREETLRAMARAGCAGINFGVESAEVEIQKGVGRKPITQERFIETIALCRELGITTFGFFIIGLPGDTVDTILNSVDFSIRMRSNWVQFTAASPLIGTKLHEMAVADGLAEEGVNAYVNSYGAMMETEHLPIHEIASLHRFAMLIGQYFINRKGILKDESRTDPVYRTLRKVADTASLTAARVVFAAGRWYFRRKMQRPALAGQPQIMQ